MLQIDFAGRVQRATDDSGAEITAEQLWQLLFDEYGFDENWVRGRSSTARAASTCGCGRSSTTW